MNNENLTQTTSLDYSDHLPKEYYLLIQGALQSVLIQSTLLYPNCRREIGTDKSTLRQLSI